VFFETDSTTIGARWTVTSPELAMSHMSATGVSGLDLYSHHWVGVGRPSGQTTTAELVSGLAPGRRWYRLYLPLYNGVRSLELGVDEGAYLAKDPTPAQDKPQPIVFYGTSITQGASASRPGMVHTSILGRWFQRPVINLGFSGNGKMDPELAQLMAEIDACIYVIDCLPNMNAEEVRERTGPFVRSLREARPGTPILLVEDRSFANARLRPAKKQHHAASRKALRAAFDALAASGYEGWLTIEAFGRAMPELAGATCIWREMFESEEQLAQSGLNFIRQSWEGT
jgi:hypothetical protein